MHKTTTYNKDLPSINNQFRKNKRYKYKQNLNQNALKKDVDTILFKLVNNQGPSESKWHKHINYINNKVSQSMKKYAFQLEYLPKVHQYDEIKTIKMQIGKYIKKMQKQNHKEHQNDYAQFMKLSQQSEDFLQFYLKNRFKSQENFQIIHQLQKSIILSILKNKYKCISQNSPQIVNRIILSLNINPLNDFHLINWTTFCKFRRLALDRSSSLQARNFLIDYIFINHKTLTKMQFKLIKIINSSNIACSLQRIMNYADHFLPQQLTKTQLQKIMVKQHFFIWSELLQLIFLI